MFAPALVEHRKGLRAAVAERRGTAAERGRDEAPAETVRRRIDAVGRGRVPGAEQVPVAERRYAGSSRETKVS